MVAATQNPELTAGHAIKDSVQAGLKVEAVVVGSDPHLDIETWMIWPRP
jgi:hypothetical protein